MPTYEAEACVWNHTLTIGDTYSPGTVSLVDGDGAALDLTGVTGVAKVRLEPGSAVLLTPTVEIVAPAIGGQFRWSSPATETADLQPGTYRYGVRLVWLDGTERTILEGSLSVRPSPVD